MKSDKTYIGDGLYVVFDEQDKRIIVTAEDGNEIILTTFNYENLFNYAMLIGFKGTVYATDDKNRTGK